MEKNFIDRFIEEDGNGQFWNLKKKIGVFVLILLFGVVITTGCTQIGNNSGDKVEDVSAETPAETSADTVSVGNDGVNAGLAEDNMVSIKDEDLSNDKMVSITLEDSGRVDPFMPESEAVAQRPKAKPKLSYDLLPPLESIGSPSMVIEKILTTKVSGIMYDNYSPSAILNIDGVDYLVRSGDVVNNYKVLSISKTMVAVQSGANVYKAGVGQLLTYDSLNQGNIANLEHKFGGSKNRSY